MRIEIWTDIICPWCGLGQKRLGLALERFGHADEIEVVHRSFQLDERAPTGSTQPVRDMLKKKTGMSDAQFEQATGTIERLAAADGLAPYIVRDNRVGNTSLAHELAAWATDQGKGDETWERLYKVYFGEARSIFDVDSLVAIAAEVGLDADAAREALTSRRYADRVTADGREARQLGASGVPFFVVDRQVAVAGAQSVDVLVKMLQAAWDKGHPGPVADGAVCEGDVCAPAPARR